MKRRILVFYWYPKELEMRLAVHQHLRTLDAGGVDEIIYHNAEDPPPRWLRWSKPDAILLHTIFLGMRWHVYATDFHRRYLWLSEMECPKLALPQDEYDHSEILEEWLDDFGVTDVFSCFGAEQRALLYPNVAPRIRFHDTLTGFIDVAAAADIAGRIVPLNERPFDLVYRAAQLPYWFGSHGQLKHEIGQIVRDRALKLGLRTDISTRYEDTIFGTEWLNFIMSGRGIIGCESGSSVLDARGLIQEKIRALLAVEPELTFAEVDERMPRGWDSYTFFAISPRHLEAVTTKTCQILVEGSYSGVLEADRHFITVRRDLSDLDAALERVRDLETVTEIVETAYEEIYLSGRYTTSSFADQLRETIGTRQARGRRPPVALLRGAGTTATTVASAAGMTKRLTRAHLGRARRSVPPSVRFASMVLSVGLTITRLVVVNPHARRMLARGLSRRTRPPLRPLAHDLLRLGILARIRDVEGTTTVPWWVDASRSCETIVLRSEPSSYEGRLVAIPDGDGPVRRIVWDHSAVGPNVPVFPAMPRLGSIAVGVDGRHEFAALGLLADRVDADLAPFLQWARLPDVA